MMTIDSMTWPYLWRFGIWQSLFLTFVCISMYCRIQTLLNWIMVWTWKATMMKPAWTVIINWKLISSGWSMNWLYDSQVQNQAVRQGSFHSRNTKLVYMTSYHLTSYHPTLTCNVIYDLLSPYILPSYIDM